MTYTPNADYNGVDSFTFRASDGAADSNTATVSITVNAVNDAPVASNDSATTDENTAVVVSVLANDIDVDGDTLSVASVTSGTNGTAVSNGASVTYMPDAGYTGDDSFDYTVSDGNGGTDTATVTVTITEVNDAPVAVDDSETTDEDTAVTIRVLVNDSDVDEDVLSVAFVTQGANGSVTNNGGDVTYTPNANWNGTDSFTYTVTDGRGGQDTATVTVTVNAVNDAPVAEDVAVSTVLDTPVDITLGASDVESDPLTHVIDTAPADGTLSDLDAAAGTVTYTPDAGFEGTDTFTYYANDGEYDSGFGTVSITVASGSDLVCTIRASGGDYNSLSAWEGAIESDLTSPASMIFGVSDADSYDFATDDGGTVTFTGGGTGTLKHVTVAGRAYVTDCVGTIEAGSVTCDVSGNAFTVSDTGRQIGSAIAECYNDWPNGLDDLLSISGWTTDLESWVIVRTPAGERHNGTLGDHGSYTGFTMAPTTNDTVVYTNQRYSRIEGIAVDWSQASGEWADGIYLRSSKGQDNADWIVDSCIVANIGHGFSGPAYAAARPGTFVNCLAYNITKEGFCSSSFTYARFLNCTAVQCKYGFTAHSFSASKPAWINCLAYSNAIQDFYEPGTGNPTADYCASGDDTADDWGGAGNRISQTFTFVDELNDDFHLAAEDTAAKDCGLDLSADSGYPFTADIDGDTRTGAWDIGMDETVGGQPPVNNPPVADSQDVTTDEDIPVIITCTAGDPEGDVLTFAIAADPAHGTLSGFDSSAGTVTYTPDADYNGADSFTFQVNDGEYDSNVATISITVNAVNDAPVAVVTADPTSGPAPLTVSLNGSGSYDIDGTIVDYEWDLDGSSDYGVQITHTYDTPGTYTVTLYVFDDDGASDEATLTITVTEPQNEAPVAENQSVTVEEDGSVAITLAATDSNGDALTYSIGDIPGYGELTGVAPNVTYVPDADYYGNDSFTFKANDGKADSDVATVSITVTPVNDAPVARDGSAVVTAGDSVGIALRAYDVDEDALTYVITAYPANGALTSDDGDNLVTYAPNGGHTGDDTFTFVATDGVLDSNTATVTVSVTGELVSIVSVSTGQPYSLAPSEVGALYYIDRKYTIQDMSAELVGAALVRTANKDKYVTEMEHLTLRIGMDAVVSVCYDRRWSVLPSWLTDDTWTATGRYVTVSDSGASPLEVYEKTVAPGEIVLGGNRAGGAAGARSNYIVLVREAGVVAKSNCGDTIRIMSPNLAPNFVVGPLAPDEWINDGDSDGDGLLDTFELEHGLDPDSIDSDADGIVDEAETVEIGAGGMGDDTAGEVIDLWDIQEGLADIDPGEGGTPGDGSGGGGGCFLRTAKRGN